ncbi:Bacteriophage P22, Gp10, DNA-stabilising [uncultured Caudovirales phage]|uniref:Bacteriophage P22, Gp10, DNA-stabilising n=1 Tax=uncultured Caudovirales phage TaxID=2100421 RepID=A0A6J5PC55_9CAUD|nr:Bacteriophage P22, Gp10, DNA-stabilising [uncultured Caudovirales phage]
MQIPILNGIYTDNTPELRTSYPVNLIPVPAKTGISAGFLKPAEGIVSNGTGTGTDRGGIEWDGVCYRVMGTKLVRVDSDRTVTTLGDVGGSELVSMDYSFDRLAIASGGNLFYWNGSVLSQVTDSDLGTVLDVCWIDGYFMTTDGANLVVTELSDPAQVNPLKYGSSELDPDPVKALLELRNEIYALNRHTIEVFDNVGGEFFPFSRIEGAHIAKGSIGTHTCCVYIEAVAFLGSGRNEAPGIYLAANGQTKKISTQEIDQLLLTYTEGQLSLCKLETRNDKNHQYLYVHLPDRTVVYDAAAAELGQVWFTLTSSLSGFSQYRARNFVWAYDKWLVGDPQSSSVGYLVDNVGAHWGQKVRWEFGTTIMYNESRGGIFHQLELIALTGSVALGTNPQISTSYSIDGKSWSQDKFINCGTTGTNKRLCWFQQGHMRNWRVQRFKGDSDAHLSFLRLEAQLTPLAY